ncbi:AlpA family transcriptional regulator [Enterobacter asburiae]|uniref:helix-turn-helix transcriptional regulator n=1 Tax=Enterobacter asburiae TaxID=61645 RepID=UPI0020765F4B|nr:AlpA family transcriptional regulator [Enterobacter asburiae]MCM7775027.1 AlpA family transcriptional regulator [Enterobacter asburiae]
MMPKARTNLSDDSFIDLKYITNDSGFTAKYFYSLIKRAESPAPIKLGRSSRWLLMDYFEWKARHIEKRDRKMHLK